VPECRNWQTNRTQNPAHFTGRVGSSPTSGTTFRHPTSSQLVNMLASECAPYQTAEANTAETPVGNDAVHVAVEFAVVPAKGAQLIVCSGLSSDKT
jgi:hypothetical protein